MCVCVCMCVRVCMRARVCVCVRARTGERTGALFAPLLEYHRSDFDRVEPPPHSQEKVKAQQSVAQLQQQVSEIDNKVNEEVHTPHQWQSCACACRGSSSVYATSAWCSVRRAHCRCASCGGGVLSVLSVLSVRSVLLMRLVCALCLVLSA